MSKIVKLVGAAIFAILLNIGLFTFAKISLTSFWISWAFIHISFVILVCILVLSVPQQKKIIFGMSESAITIYYFIIELVAGLVLMFQFAFFPVASFVIQMVILAAFAVLFLATKFMNQDINSKEQVRAVELYQFKYILEEMKAVLRQVDYSAPYKQLIEHAYDSMAASQVKSSEEAALIEGEIRELIKQLQQAVSTSDEVAILQLCKQMETAIAERNSKLRLHQ